MVLKYFSVTWLSYIFLVKLFLRNCGGVVLMRPTHERHKKPALSAEMHLFASIYFPSYLQVPATAHFIFCILKFVCLLFYFNSLLLFDAPMTSFNWCSAFHLSLTTSSTSEILRRPGVLAFLRNSRSDSRSFTWKLAHFSETFTDAD